MKKFYQMSAGASFSNPTVTFLSLHWCACIYESLSLGCTSCLAKVLGDQTLEISEIFQNARDLSASNNQ